MSTEELLREQVRAHRRIALEALGYIQGATTHREGQEYALRRIHLIGDLREALIRHDTEQKAAKA